MVWAVVFYSLFLFLNPTAVTSTPLDGYFLASGACGTHTAIPAIAQAVLRNAGRCSAEAMGIQTSRANSSLKRCS